MEITALSSCAGYEVVNTIWLTHWRMPLHVNLSLRVTSTRFSLSVVPHTRDAETKGVVWRAHFRRLQRFLYPCPLHGHILLWIPMLLTVQHPTSKIRDLLATVSRKNQETFYRGLISGTPEPSHLPVNRCLSVSPFDERKVKPALGQRVLID